MIRKIRDKFYNLAISYSVPSNINIFWNFGVLAFFFLISQILTGIFLAMHYVPTLDGAYASVEHIMRDVTGGWLIRYLHSNGASLFFFVVYIHLFRGLYYSSYVYPRIIVWIIGVIILLLMILTAFLGYVLPWGQMSFWAATVITNLASAIPIIGTDIVTWLWGAFSVSAPTLNRFYSLHYILPIIILFLIVLHVIFLHFTLSNHPLGTQPDTDEIKFGIFFIIKDLYGIFLILVIFGIFLYFYPNLLSHSDNYIKANPLVTPNHIVPEWYFLPFYAILRSVPNKLFGVILLLLSILVLILLPFIVSTNIRATTTMIDARIWFYLFFVNCIILGWIGSQDIIRPYYEIGQLSTFFYFFYFLIILPFIHAEVKLKFKNENYNGKKKIIQDYFRSNIVPDNLRLSIKEIKEEKKSKKN